MYVCCCFFLILATPFFMPCLICIIWKSHKLRSWNFGLCSDYHHEFVICSKDWALGSSHLLISTLHTRACDGPVLHFSTMRSTAEDLPENTASTVPSSEFRTHPVRPKVLACSRVHFRKNTPCTFPLIFTFTYCHGTSHKLMGLKYSCILFHTWGDYLDVKLFVSFMYLKGKKKKNQKKLKSLFKFFKRKKHPKIYYSIFWKPIKKYIIILHQSKYIK